MTGFQCRRCHFRNINGRDPVHGDRRDALFEKCIRRASLDAFWSKEDLTVQGTRSSIKAAILKADMIGGDKIFPALGPLPLKDVDGLGAAALQLLKTLDPGINEPLVQHSTATKMTAALGALWEVSKVDLGRLGIWFEAICVTSIPDLDLIFLSIGKFRNISPMSPSAIQEQYINGRLAVAAFGSQKLGANSDSFKPQLVRL
jgi:hypothetical protein